MVNPLLSAASLCVERGGRTVLSRLSFSLAPGEVLLVSGRNGAGKSTLLRTLSGLLQPVSGTVAYGLADEEVRGAETVHYLGYEDALKPSLSLRENLEFWASLLRRTKAAVTAGVEPFATPALDVRAALDTFGIGRLEALPAAYLSAGQKRRAALARLLLAPRPIWLLDEPLIALDAAAQATLTAVMADHVAVGGAILVASHQPLALPHRELALGERTAAA